MSLKNRIFLDTSTIVAAVFSETGGARKLFQLGEVEVLQLVIGPNVLRECEDVLRRRMPGSLPKLAHMLELARVETASQPPAELIEEARSIVEYRPDAYVLAEAMAAEPDWFITHDKEHFLDVRPVSRLSFRVGTPGDLIQFLEDEHLQK